MTTNPYSNPDSENPQPPNWRDIDTSTPEGRDALNREIARRLGWQHKVQQHPLMSTDIVENTWITYPEYPPTGNTLDHFPHDWANSVDAALMLPVSDNFAFSLYDSGDVREHPKWDAVFLFLGGEQLSPTYLQSAPTPALAICKAWLEMTDGGVK
jgi:hypothetical protein